MLKILASTALVSALATGAFAQEATPPAAPDPAAPILQPDPAAPEAPMAQDNNMMAPEPDAMEAQDNDMMAPAEEPSVAQTPGMSDPVAEREGWDEPGEGYTRIAIDTVSADQLIGTDIYSLDDETVATIDDVVLSTDGAVENVVAEFGGFLGFGANTVLLTMDEIDVLEDESGALIVRTNLTPETLEGRPSYEAPAAAPAN